MNKLIQNESKIRKLLTDYQIYPIPLPRELTRAWVQYKPLGWVAGYPKNSQEDERVCVRTGDADIYLEPYGRR